MLCFIASFFVVTSHHNQLVFFNCIENPQAGEFLWMEARWVIHKPDVPFGWMGGFEKCTYGWSLPSGSGPAFVWCNLPGSHRAPETQLNLFGQAQHDLFETEDGFKRKEGGGGTFWNRSASFFPVCNHATMQQRLEKWVCAVVLQKLVRCLPMKAAGSTKAWVRGGRAGEVTPTPRWMEARRDYHLNGELQEEWEISMYSVWNPGIGYAGFLQGYGNDNIFKHLIQQINKTILYSCPPGTLISFRHCP